MDSTPKRLQEQPTVYLAGSAVPHPPPPGGLRNFPLGASTVEEDQARLIAELQARVDHLHQQMDDQRQQREVAMWGTSDEKAHVIAQLSEANAGLNHTLNVCCELLLMASGAMRPVVDAMRGGGVVLTPKNVLGASIEDAVSKISAVLGGQP